MIIGTIIIKSDNDLVLIFILKLLYLRMTKHIERQRSQHSILTDAKALRLSSFLVICIKSPLSPFLIAVHVYVF